MSRVKVIKRKIPIAGGQSTMEALNNLLGNSKDIGVVYPKYSNAATHIEACRDVLRELTNVPIFRAEKWKPTASAIDQYCLMIEEHLAQYFSINLGEYMLDLSKTPKELQDRIFEQYDGWKEHTLTSTLIKTCDSLHQYRDVLESPSIEFVLNVAGNSWEPLPFIRLNFKDLFIDISEFAQKEKMSTIIFKTIKILYEHTKEIYNIRTSPDIDADKFVATILECVEQLRKNPKLSRCQRALNKIVSSAELLKTRMGAYYRDFVETKSASTIMENFIADVSETCGQEDIYMISEFKQIAQYFEEVQSKNPQKNNPEMQKLFSSVMDNINKISELAPNLKEDAKPTSTPKQERPKKEQKPKQTSSNKLASMTAEEISKLSPDEIAKFLN